MSNISAKGRTSHPGNNPVVGKVLPLTRDIKGGPTVLVVDDNDDTRTMLHTLLAYKGYRVIEAADGEQAIEVTSQENPGLVLLDLGLPRMNGLSVIRRLRNESKLLNVPVVVITGYDKHFNTAVSAGCDDYLVKPIDFSRLDAILEYYVPTKASAAGV
jgi:DNA-binding response OmpR family regulator